MADLSPQYRKAEEALNRRNYDYARDLYLDIIMRAPDEVEARRRLYATLLAKFREQGAPSKVTTKFAAVKTTALLKTTKDPDRLVEIAQKYLLSDPQNDRVRTCLAQALFEKGHRMGALEEARIAMEVNPQNAEANKLVARIQIELGRPDEARAALTRAIRANPQDREAEKLLRDLEATATMKRGFETAQTYRDVLKDKQKADLLEKQQHLIKTEADVQMLLNELLKQHQAAPSDVRTVKKIAEIHFDIRRDFPTAQQWFRKGSEMDPYDSTLKDRIEDCDIRMAEMEIARARQRGDAAAAEKLAATKLHMEIQAYERRVRDRPTDMALRYELGQRYYAAGNLDGAIRELQNAVKDPNRRVDASILLGNCFRIKKLYELADQQYRNAEQGALREDTLIYIWYHWAVCCEEWGKADRARELLMKVVAKKFDYRDAAQRLERLRAAGA